MKLALLIFFLSTSKLLALDNDSFRNHDKYIFLKLPAISHEAMTVDLRIQFFPPEGKKVNSGSMLRMWEKNVKTKEWEIVDKAYTEGVASILESNQLLKSLSFKNRAADQALEIDFIHCNYQGGQCQMQKYLGKIKREKGGQSFLQMKLQLPKT